MNAPCYSKLPEKEIFPSVIEHKLRSCKYFSWQICEDNVSIFVPTCAFGTMHESNNKTTEVSGIPIRPPLKDSEGVVERPEGCPIGMEDKTEPLVFTVGKIPIGDSYQTTLEGLLG